MAIRRKRYRVREHQLYSVKPSVWKQLKQENEIDQLYRFRAQRIEWASRLLFPAAKMQGALHHRQISRISFEEHPPVFILGLWRSGTTHLHYMMARDPRFGFLNNHQAFTFNFSLLSMDRLNGILNVFVPGRRPQDDVRISLNEPAEEEQPFSTLSARSSIHSFYFPRNQSYFTKYHLFKDITIEEMNGWKKDYLFLLRNISYYNKRKTLLLKNPHNTGRVRELLGLFPDAKFIFIHRDPFRVYSSTKRLYTHMISSQFLQFCPQREINRLILENNAEILRKYLRERSLIPCGNLIEIGFSELEQQPLPTLEKIYSELGFPGFEEARAGFEAYLDSVKRYRKNRYRPLPERMQQKIKKNWDFYFEAFGY